MTLITASILLLSGLLLLGFTADILVKGSVSLAVRHGIPKSVVGLTIVAFGTSAPELVTSITANFKGAPDASVGNVIGSNLFNLLVVVGVSCLLKPVGVGKLTRILEWPFLILSGVLFLWLGRDSQFDRLEGLTLFTIFCAFVFFIIRMSKGKDVQVDEEIQLIPEKWKEWFFIVSGIVGLAIAAQVALEGAVFLGKYVGMSERLIGLTILSVGTSLPELATSTVAAMRGHDEISVGNVIGSNVMNILAVVGATATISNIDVNPIVISHDGVW
ncbi:MAG: calcium/sodium antiporter, partial [Bdellovibrionales bacterium]|nr:calcium/sodium antiporter [Bdellovibrionales bacterium]